MKLRWYITVNGDKTLQCFNEDFEYWADVGVEFEAIEQRENRYDLYKRIRELENDLKILSELKK